MASGGTRGIDTEVVLKEVFEEKLSHREVCQGQIIPRFSESWRAAFPQCAVVHTRSFSTNS